MTSGALGLTFELITQESIHELEAWFDDAATRRYLGDSSWLVRALALVQEPPGAEFRGRRVLGRYIWIVREAASAIALLDVEPYDDGTAGVALVVAPTVRGKGIGRLVAKAAHQRPELSAVREFVGAIEPGNVAANRCARGAGFEVAEQQDDEGMFRISRRTA